MFSHIHDVITELKTAHKIYQNILKLSVKARHVVLCGLLFETLVPMYQIIRCNISQERRLHIYCRQISRHRLVRKVTSPHSKTCLFKMLRITKRISLWQSDIQGQSCDVSVTTFNRSSLIRCLRYETHRYISATKKKQRLMILFLQPSSSYF
jgi:hypothetical protein